MKNNINYKKGGFTLIELMIVIVILGFLIGIVLSNFSTSQKKGKDSQKADLRQMAEALEMYYNDYGRYPAASAANKIMGCGAGGASACPISCPSGGNNVFAAGPALGNGCATIYIVRMPENDYYYISGSTSYKLYVYLENDKDSEINTTIQGYNYDCGDATRICNYGISSSNVTP